MDTRRLQKLLAGAGLVCMLLGASMVTVPGAGADEHLLDFVDKVSICHRTNSVTNPYRIIEVAVDSSDGSLGNGINDHTGHLGPAFDPELEYSPPLDGDDWGDIIPPFQWGPEPGQVFLGLNWTEGMSLEDQCGGDATTLTIVKQVAGAAAPSTWSYDFTGLPETETLTLTDTEDTSDTFVIEPDTDYDIVEVDAEGATTTTASCVGEDSESFSGLTLSVSVAAGEDAVCTFVNTFSPNDDTTIEVVKSVTGPQRPTTWNFGFTGLVDTAATCPEGSTATFCLDQTTSTTGAVIVDDGSHTLTELQHRGANTTVSCTNVTETANSGGSITFTIAEGADAVCTFVNHFPGSGPPPTGSLSLDKVVTGGSAPIAATEYGFSVDCGAVDLNGVAAGNIVTVSLRANESPMTFADLPVGTVCTVVEIEDAGAAQTTYGLNGGATGAALATATIVANATQAVVVTNDFPTVLVEEEERPPAPPVTNPPPVSAPPIVEPEAEVAPVPVVLGDVVTRPQALARTGTESSDLAVAGAGLLALGAAMVLSSRMRYRRFD